MAVDKTVPQFPFPRENIGIQLIGGGKFGGILVFALSRRVEAESRPTIRSSIGDLTPAVHIHAHLFGDLGLGGVAFHRRRQFARNRFELLVALAQVPRCPVHIAQAVENGAFDPMLGVAVKADMFLAVVFTRGVKQTHDSGVDQIVDIHVNRQVLIDPDGDRPHQRRCFSTSSSRSLWFVCRVGRSVSGCASGLEVVVSILTTENARTPPIPFVFCKCCI